MFYVYSGYILDQVAILVSQCSFSSCSDRAQCSDGLSSGWCGDGHTSAYFTTADSNSLGQHCGGGFSDCRYTTAAPGSLSSNIDSISWLCNNPNAWTKIYGGTASRFLTLFISFICRARVREEMRTTNLVRDARCLHKCLCRLRQRRHCRGRHCTGHEWLSGRRQHNLRAR